jgi:hypothetical protein
MTKHIFSIFKTDAAALLAIRQMHNGGKDFDTDVTFNKGSIYQGGKEFDWNVGMIDMPIPELKFDIAPMSPDVRQADCRHLPLADASIESLIFDPPFAFGNHGTNRIGAAPRGRTDPASMNARYSQFKSLEELTDVYQGALDEFSRVLKPKGIVAFKCMDFTDKKTTMTSCLVHDWANERGFYIKDALIKVKVEGKIYNPNLIQRHARKVHAYWLVLVKVRPSANGISR